MIQSEPIGDFWIEKNSDEDDAGFDQGKETSVLVPNKFVFQNSKNSLNIMPVHPGMSMAIKLKSQLLNRFFHSQE